MIEIRLLREKSIKEKERFPYPARLREDKERVAGQEDACKGKTNLIPQGETMSRNIVRDKDKQRTKERSLIPRMLRDHANEMRANKERGRPLESYPARHIKQRSSIV